MAVRILVADETPNIQNRFQQALETSELASAGFELRAVPSGKDVLQHVESWSPDLVFVDVLLPHKSGYEVAEELAHHPEWNKIPVVLTYSGFVGLDEQKYQQSGARACIEKPFDDTVLQNSVLELIGPSVQPTAPTPDATAPEAVPLAAAPIAQPPEAAPTPRADIGDTDSHDEAASNPFTDEVFAHEAEGDADDESSAWSEPEESLPGTQIRNPLLKDDAISSSADRLVEEVTREGAQPINEAPPTEEALPTAEAPEEALEHQVAAPLDLGLSPAAATEELELESDEPQQAEEEVVSLEESLMMEEPALDPVDEAPSPAEANQDDAKAVKEENDDEEDDEEAADDLAMWVQKDLTSSGETGEDTATGVMRARHQATEVDNTASGVGNVFSDEDDDELGTDGTGELSKTRLPDLPSLSALKPAGPKPTHQSSSRPKSQSPHTQSIGPRATEPDVSQLSEAQKLQSQKQQLHKPRLQKPEVVAGRAVVKGVDLSAMPDLDKKIEQAVHTQAKKIIEQVVWKVVPELAGRLIEKELNRLLQENEGELRLEKRG